ncbi:MAG: DUF4838 domain-containing protein [bacterium]|nr:DUF4838 domain-containing protein [bacterium]
MRLTTVAAALAALTICAGGHAMTLAKDGATEYVIVRPEACTPVVVTATNDLQAHLQQITGATFDIRTDAAPLPPKAIVVGACRGLSDLGVTPDWDALGDEGYVIQTAGDRLVIVGGPVRGTAYGVYGLLADHLGCRWFTPDVAEVPEQRSLELPIIDETVAPELMYRETFWIEAKDPLWNLRNRMNASWIIRLDEAHGGCFYYHAVHTFNSFCPPETYFNDHPEYFSLIDGERSTDRTQLCLTNPDVLNLAIEWARQRFREDPYAMVVSISQNDWRKPCQCEACQKIAREEESEAGPVIWFVNQVADAVKEEFPNRYIGTLAYQYTRKAPKTLVPRDNVAIRLCSIECSFSEPLDSGTSEVNDTFVADIKAWNQKTDSLFIWDYTTNFSHYVQPFPNLRSIQPNIRFFIDHGVKGLFEQGNYNGTGGGELADLRNYLLARFLWNPDLDFDTELDAFLSAYYGAAATPLREYLDYIHDRAGGGQHHIGLGYRPTGAFFRGEFLEKANAWFDAAAAAVAGDAALAARVRKARLPIDYVGLFHGDDRYGVTDGAYTAVLSEDTSARMDAFVTALREIGITQVNEWNDVDKWLAGVRNPRPSWPVVTLDNGTMRVEIAPEGGGRIVGVFTQDADANWMTDVSYFDHLNPGYEEWIGPEGAMKGGREVHEASVVGNTATLTAALDNGLHITRQVILADAGNELTIRTTVRNDAESAQTVSMWTRPDFRVDETLDRLLIELTANGYRGEVTEGEQGEVVREGQDVPQGEWAFVNKPLERAAVFTFNPAHVVKTRAGWANGRQTHELFSKPWDAQPGGSATFEQCIQFLTGIEAADYRKSR